MSKLILPQLSVLVLIMAFSVQATGLDDQQDHGSKNVTDLNFSAPLFPTELPIIEYCKQQEIEVNWQEAREALYENAMDDYDMFEATAHDYLRINRLSLEKLGLAKLHQQYADLYTALNTPSLNLPRKDSSASSSSLLSELEEEEGQDDTTGVVITFPNAATGLRHRHSPPGGATIPVK